MAASTIGEVKVLVEGLVTQVNKMDEKFDALSTSVTEHHAKDLDKCKKIDQLYLDIHGDGNGKKGLRREFDMLNADLLKMKEFVDGIKRLSWITITAAVGSVIALVANVIKDVAR